MKIEKIDIRLCRHDGAAAGKATLNTGVSSGLEFLVISLHTDEGISGHSFCFETGKRTLEAYLNADLSKDDSGIQGVEAYLRKKA